MPEITINKIVVDVPDGTTLLEAAAQLGIQIPTLCYTEGKRPNTSCMICVVEEARQKRLLPACAAKAEAGMAIETDSEAVLHARRAVLELLLSEHLGDCEAPCERACPAGLNIPLMLRCLMQEDLQAAQALVRRALVLPATLGRVCTAPCEAGCRRGSYDKSIAIRQIHGQLGELSYDDAELSCSERKVAIVGAGPAGLAAAYVLRTLGYACRIYERGPLAGGALRKFPEEQLPREVLDAELLYLTQMGIEFICETEVGKTVSLEQLQETCDAVVVACSLDVPASDKIFRAEEKKMPVRSIASGKQAAQAAHTHLAGVSDPLTPPYNSTMGRLPKEQLGTYIIGREKHKKRGLTQANASETCLSPLFVETQEEAARCLHCDCHAPVSCKLRQYATQYGVRPKVFRDAERPLPNGLQRFGDVIFDVGKCIKCGLCVSITQANKEDMGLTFTQRGFAMQVSIPFNESLEKALIHSARECVENCPTGAIAFETKEERIR